MCSETRAQVVSSEEEWIEVARIEAAGIDALWFSRASPGKREAWELRLVAETQYALLKRLKLMSQKRIGTKCGARWKQG